MLARAHQADTACWNLQALNTVRKDACEMRRTAIDGKMKRDIGAFLLAFIGFAMLVLLRKLQIWSAPLYFMFAFWLLGAVAVADFCGRTWGKLRESRGK